MWSVPATNERDKRTTSDKIKQFEEFWSEQDGEQLRLVTAVIVGAGLRGQNYANFALDFSCRPKIVGVAEPQDHRRKNYKNYTIYLMSMLLMIGVN